MPSPKFSSQTLGSMMNVPHVLDRLVDVAEDAMLVPAVPRVDEPLERPRSLMYILTSEATPALL
eukprot:12904501-Alexandrium_andersonii.AAC.1